MRLGEALVLVQALNALDAQRVSNGQFTEAQLEAIQAINAALFEADYNVKFKLGPSGWSYQLVGYEAVIITMAA